MSEPDDNPTGNADDDLRAEFERELARPIQIPEDSAADTAAALKTLPATLSRIMAPRIAGIQTMALAQVKAASMSSLGTLQLLKTPATLPVLQSFSAARVGQLYAPQIEKTHKLIMSRFAGEQFGKNWLTPTITSPSYLSMLGALGTAQKFRPPVMGFKPFLPALMKSLQLPKFPSLMYADLAKTINVGLTRQLAGFDELFRGSLRNLWGLVKTGSEAVRAYALRALAAAFRARDAVLYGRQEEIDAFIADWLELNPNALARRDAVASILLSDDWLPPDHVAYDAGVIKRIKSMALDDRWVRPHKFIGETQLRYGRVGSLDAEIRRPSEDVTSLLDEVADPRSWIEPSFNDTGWTDHRLVFIAQALKPDETAVLHALSEDEKHTWSTAADEAGVDLDCAERTRRKVRRLAAEYYRRHPGTEGRR